MSGFKCCEHCDLDEIHDVRRDWHTLGCGNLGCVGTEQADQ